MIDRKFLYSEYSDAPIFKLGQLRCSSYFAWDLGADGGDAAAIGASRR
jgi:hypothetical protein